MTLRGLIIVMCAFLCSWAHGQEKLIAIKYLPSALLSPNYPSYMFGLEVKPIKHWSISGDYGFQAPSLLWQWNSDKHNIQLRKAKLAVRYYPFEYVQNIYFSVEIYRVSQSYARYDDWYKTREGLPYEYEVAFMAIDERGYTLNGGINLFTGKRFYFDFSGGIGQRWIGVTYNQTIGQAPMTHSTFEEWSSPNDRKEGRHKKYQIMLSARIGFLLFKTDP